MENKLITPQVGLASSYPKLKPFSPADYLKKSAKVKVDKKKIAKEDPPIEPVYSVSPVMLKQGLASMLTKFGL